MSKPRLCSLVLAVFAAVLLGACEGGGAPTGNDDEEAFLQAMVPHHTSAVDMAKIADREAKTPFVKNLAAEITRTQTAEINQMRSIHGRLFHAELEPNPGGHMQLGLSAKDAGMEHMDAGMMLRGKKPFDRAFVDEMTAHHQGAIKMAQAVLGRTQDPELQTLAQNIISAQKREIAEMNAFRKREYGAPVPAPVG